jgi:hypothetical protein
MVALLQLQSTAGYLLQHQGVVAEVYSTSMVLRRECVGPENKRKQTHLHITRNNLHPGAFVRVRIFTCSGSHGQPRGKTVATVYI